MFFQSIYQMMPAGTDLSINIRKMDGNLSVAVMPKRTGLKDEAGQLIVPLILNGTPVELDGEFLQAVTAPLQKAQGILVNLEAFEKQAEQATAQSKAVKSANNNEPKEVREKREKMERLLNKSDEAFTAGKYQEAIMWLKQARALATPDKQKEIDIQMQEVQKKANEGSLFADATPQTQSVMQQAPNRQEPPTAQQQANGIPKGQTADGQMQMFAPQPMSQPTQQPVPQPEQQQPMYQPMYQNAASQPIPQPRIMEPQPAAQAYQPGVSQPRMVYGQYYQQPAYGIPGQPMGQQPAGQPQMYIPQPGGQPQQPQQWQQPQPMPQQPQAPVMQAAPGTTEREYHSQPQPTGTPGFDKDDESDRERLREDPYSEYIDFPEEYRMKDEAQMETICC